MIMAQLEPRGTTGSTGSDQSNEILEPSDSQQTSLCCV
jgi:hypothetical protein